MQHQQDLWDRIWKDRQGRVVIYQWPNPWLYAWAALSIASLLTNDTISNIFGWLATIDLAIWSVLEITQGVNYFRRAFGVTVLLFTLASAFRLGM